MMFVDAALSDFSFHLPNRGFAACGACATSTAPSNGRAASSTRTDLRVIGTSRSGRVSGLYRSPGRLQVEWPRLEGSRRVRGKSSTHLHHIVVDAPGTRPLCSPLADPGLAWRHRGQDTSRATESRSSPTTSEDPH